MAGYSPTAFVNGTTPAINADNLNKTEQGVECALGYDSLQDLRDEGTPTSVQTAFCRGHTSCGDGGAGWFYWDSSSTDSDDDGITLLPTSHVGAGRWVRMFTGAINVLWFGAIPNDNTVDNAPIINGAFTAAKGRVKVHLPSVDNAGVSGLTYYYIEQPVEVPNGCHLFGDGQKLTRIQVSTTTWSGTYAVRIGDGDHVTAPEMLGTRCYDMTIDASTQNGVWAGYTTQANEGSGFERCQLSAADSSALRISQSDVGDDAATTGSPKNFHMRDLECYTLDAAVGNYTPVIWMDTPFFQVFEGITAVGKLPGSGTAVCVAGIYCIGGCSGTIKGVHCEGAVNGILIGAAGTDYAYALSVEGVTGPSASSEAVTTLVTIAANSSNQNLSFKGLLKRSATNTLSDFTHPDLLTYQDIYFDYSVGTGAVGQRRILHNSALFDGSDLPFFSEQRDTKFLQSFNFKKVATGVDLDLDDLNPAVATTFVEVTGTTSRTITMPEATNWDGRVIIIAGSGAATTHTIARTGSNLFADGTTPTSITLGAYECLVFIGSDTGVGLWFEVST